MSDASRRTGRPQQVTLGAGTVIAAGAIHVLSSFDDMSSLRTVESKDRAQEIIKSAANSGFSLTQTQVLDLMHAGVLVSGAAAAAAVVMGIYALRGHRAAPPTLIGISALVVLGSLLTDPLMGMVLAAGTMILWSGPARDWFAGRPVRPSRVESAMAESRRSGAAGPATGAKAPPEPPSASPPPQPGAPSAPTHPVAQPPPYQPAPSHPRPYQPPHQRPGQPLYGQQPSRQQPPLQRRTGAGAVPGVVRAAALITVVASTMVAMLYVLCLLLLAVAREPILTELRKNPDVQRVDLGGADLVAVVAIASVILLIWSLSALVLAVLTWRGHNWARILLMMSSVVMVLLCVVGLPVSLPLLLAGGVVVTLLMMPQAREYFASGRFVAPLPAVTGAAPWGDAQGQSPQQGQSSPYGPPSAHGSQPPQGQLPPPSNVGDQQPPPPPAPQDPTKDEDGKPPVW